MAAASQDDSVLPTEAGDVHPAALALLARGTQVARYIIADLIGRGGMGVVYKARLLREAQALVQLSHPNVVTVYDVGTHADAVFMAMEFVEGKNLREVLEEGRLTTLDRLAILKAAGRGLSAAHEGGIIHRDFKPANVIIGNDGRVRVIDFGLARGAEPEAPVRPGEEPQQCLDSSGNLLSSTLNQAGAVVGTPQYMAPEQHLGLAVDDKTDQFSFAVVLFEAMRRESCEATYGRGAQSERMLDLRTRCLERRLGEVRALTALLATRTDGGVLDRAVQAALGMIGLDRCEDARALSALVPPPEALETLRQVSRIRTALDGIDALEKIGKYAEGLKLAEQTAEEARQVPYPPALAEALVRVGSLEDKTGDFNGAAQQLRSAFLIAESCGHTEAKAKALNRLISVVGDHQARFAEAEEIAEHAEAVIQFSQDRGETLASWHNNVGVLLDKKGEPDRALLHYKQALAHFATQKSVPARKMQAAARSWLEGRGVHPGLASPPQTD